MAGITRQKQRRGKATNVASLNEGVLQGEVLPVVDGTTGAVTGIKIGPMVFDGAGVLLPDATTLANDIPTWPPFTAALLSKLNAIEDSADVNPPLLTSEELAVLTEVSPRTFSPAQIKAAIDALAVGTVLSVNGEINDVVLTLSDIDDADGKVSMLQTERDKLAAVEEGATADQTAADVISLLDGALGAPNWRVDSDIAYTELVPMSFVGPQLTWSAKPQTSTPAEFSGGPTRYRVDARKAVAIQLTGGVNIAADGTHRLLLQYNITADAVGEGGAWVTITGSDISIATTGDKASTVAAFPPAAKIENCWIRLAGDAVTGTTQSPKFTQVRALMWVAIDTSAPVASTSKSTILSLFGASSSTYTGAPVGLSEWRSGGGLDETTRWLADLSRATRYQFMVNSGSTGLGAILVFEYSTDAGGTWTALPSATISAYSSSSTDKTTGWLAPPAGVGACMMRLSCNNTTGGTISPLLRSLYLVIDETAPTPFSQPATTVFTAPVSFSTAGNISWAIPVGTNVVLGVAAHIPVDLRKVTDICLMLSTATGAPAAGTTAQIEYSLDNAIWALISGTQTAIDGAIGEKVGPWATVPSDARVPELVYLRCTVTAATGATASFRMVTGMLRQEVTVILPDSGGGVGETTTYAEIASTQTGTITGPDADMVMCFNTAAITVNLPPAPRKSQVYWCLGGAISFFGGTGQTIQGGGFTGAAGSGSIPQIYPFIRRVSAPTVWVRGR